MLVNVSTIGDYLQLKVMPSLEMGASVVIGGGLDTPSFDTTTTASNGNASNDSSKAAAASDDVSGDSSATSSSQPSSASATSGPGQCTVLIFYLDWCPFSAKAAAAFNALGRLYPQLNILAIDAYTVYG